MKFFGEDIKQVDKGYFGVRRCTICNDELQDVNLVELNSNFNIFFIPVRKLASKHILVCQNCGAFMEINEELWKYYLSYLNKRFNKSTTDEIIQMLTDMNEQLITNGVKLELDNKYAQQSIDLIYRSMVEKYKVCENVEELISVFYK